MLSHSATLAQSHLWCGKTENFISMSPSHSIKNKLPISQRSTDPYFLTVSFTSTPGKLDILVTSLRWHTWESSDSLSKDCISTLIILPFLFHFLKDRIGLWKVVKLQPECEMPGLTQALSLFTASNEISGFSVAFWLRLSIIQGQSEVPVYCQWSFA